GAGLERLAVGVEARLPVEHVDELGAVVDVWRRPAAFGDRELNHAHRVAGVIARHLDLVEPAEHPESVALTSLPDSGPPSHLASPFVSCRPRRPSRTAPGESRIPMALGLVALTIVIAFTGQGGRRLLAVVSAGTLAATIFHVAVGGPLLFATWLTAAALAIALA